MLMNEQKQTSQKFRAAWFNSKIMKAIENRLVLGPITSHRNEYSDEFRSVNVGLQFATYDMKQHCSI